MKTIITSAIIVAVVTLSGCATTGMTVTAIDKSGRSQTTSYSNNYSAGEWVSLGQVGLDMWIDHEKESGPLHGLQQATGTLGPSDLRATGLVTLYFVNLEARPRQVADLMVAVAGGKGEPLKVAATEVASRALTKVVPGRVPISNYGTEVALSIQFKLDGVTYSTSPVLKRRTVAEMREPGKDLPWLQAPYFPFNPPLGMPK